MLFRVKAVARRVPKDGSFGRTVQFGRNNGAGYRSDSLKSIR